MNDHKGCIKSYTRSSKAWYRNTKERIEVWFGMFDPDGGTSGEMCMEWIELSGNLCARLKCFEDGWSALALFPDLIKKMGESDSKLIQEEDFVKILEGCGFKDITEYVDPNEGKEILEEEMITIKMPIYKAERLGLINDKNKVKSHG